MVDRQIIFPKTSLIFKYLVNLRLSIEVNILLRQLSIVIGRSFSSISASPLFLNTGFIMPCSHVSGIQPELRTLFNSFI